MAHFNASHYQLFRGVSHFHPNFGAEWVDRLGCRFGMDKLERRGYNMQKESRRYPFRLDRSLLTGVFNVYIVVFIKLS